MNTEFDIQGIQDNENLESNSISWEMDDMTDNTKQSAGLPSAAPMMLPNESGVLTPIEQDIVWKGQMIKVYVKDYRYVPIIKLQIVACLMLFAVFGMNDQTTGAMMPTLQERYDISSATVSNIFLFQIGGYTIASFVNEWVHRKVGVRGVIFLSSLMSVVFYTLMLLEPPNFFCYLLYVLPLGLSVGLIDCTCSVLFGTFLVHKNEWMGALHGVYGIASMFAPPIAAHFSESAHWNRYFSIPLFGSILGLALSLPAFKHETAIKYDYECSHEDIENSEINNNNVDVSLSQKSNTENYEENELNLENQFTSSNNEESGFALLKKPIILLYASYLFFYLGAEVGTGAFLLSFLMKNKCPNRVAMSYIASAYWAGLTIGRFVLGFVTNRCFKNEYRAAKMYTYITIIGYTTFVLISFINPHDSTNPKSAYFIIFFIVTFISGVFIGPLFPNASIVALQVLPKKYHISGLGISVAVGGFGCALLPYIVGIITHFTGLWLYPILIWLMVVIFSVIWEMYPKYIIGNKEYL